jgi:hypothetical protein
MISTPGSPRTRNAAKLKLFPALVNAWASARQTRSDRRTMSFQCWGWGRDSDHGVQLIDEAILPGSYESEEFAEAVLSAPLVREAYPKGCSAWVVPRKGLREQCWIKGLAKSGEVDDLAIFQGFPY